MTNNELTRYEQIEMHREIFKKRTDNFKVIIPRDLIKYLDSKKETNTWKGKFILLYMGVYITYREGFFTYKRRSMNIWNIMELMNLGRSNRSLSKEFSKKGYLAENGYITHVNDIPLSYSIVRNGRIKRTVYNMAKEVSKDKLGFKLDNYPRQLRAIEPTLNIKGKTRVRGRGIEVIRKPLEEDVKDTISFSYDTIFKVVSGRLTENDLWALVKLKEMTGNKTMTSLSKFKTNMKTLGQELGVSRDGYKSIHKNLKRCFDEKQYSLEQECFRNNNEFSSNVYLILSNNI